MQRNCGPKSTSYNWKKKHCQLCAKRAIINAHHPQRQCVNKFWSFAWMAVVWIRSRTMHLSCFPKCPDKAGMFTPTQCLQEHYVSTLTRYFLTMLKSLFGFRNMAEHINKKQSFKSSIENKVEMIVCTASKTIHVETREKHFDCKFYSANYLINHSSQWVPPFLQTVFKFQRCIGLVIT